ncbi:hypothetical protein DCO58_10905 [Helicobacter saguini]|nr:SEL1-like repeat protein [Helicobacter saguini]MWV61193.1 hypothetical protein [Helicobacter saguini]MWV68140.1 hypothetical protein [Helicobacter saguini]MWV70397.1 hypothetical protein [Helicobacter saguini]MWV72298.1 hypothetical protein [Helicobacter saguini]
MARFAILFFIFYGVLFGVESSLDSKDLAKYGDFNSFSLQCKRKDFKGCYYLGLSYLSGFQVLPNQNEAKKYLQLACQNDILESCLSLNQHGDTNEKLEIYKKACENNSLESCKKLAQILEQNISFNAAQSQKLEVLTILQKICKLSADSKCKIAAEFQEKYMVNNDLEMLSECNDAIKEYDNLSGRGASKLQVCGAVGDAFANGKIDSKIPKDKQKAAYYYDFACKANKVYCYKYELDSILNP